MQAPRPAIRSGANDGQLRHTFRHIDRLGLDREAVTTAILEDLSRRQPISPGSYIAGNVVVGGVALEYRAFLLNDGTINIGRITGA
ncbi:MAG TPA: hypothetical protein VFQ82_10655 [Stellaceae bacterium]|jgi:hypothetical protein|nr:hypothetical protein [Stellaceae bacterium]